MSVVVSGAVSGADQSRVALVTGAGRRVGRAIALDLATQGWSVAVHHHASAAGAADVVEQIRVAGGRAEAFAADLTDPVALEALIPNVVAWSGRLDALVSSAAGMTRTPIGSTTAASVDGILALNLRAPFLLAQSAAAHLAEGGAIVLIGDHMADESWPDYAMHGVAKAGVHALTRHLAAALAPRIRVNAVAPGAVLLPDDGAPQLAERLSAEAALRRIGTPSDVAGAVRYLLDAPFVTGQVLRVDGGRGLDA
ncbi:MAG: SDR family oxidoreductase [Gemmatimonadetes bacterium]|nr:SDR family oxidoreductase [Gemmatimonadota bacterium]